MSSRTGFRISSPVNIVAETKRGLRELEKADDFLEFATRRAFDIFIQLKFAKKPLTPAGEKVLRALSTTHESLVDARQSLGNAAQDLERALKEME